MHQIHDYLKGEIDYWDIEEGGSGAIAIQHCHKYTTFSICNTASQVVFIRQF